MGLEFCVMMSVHIKYGPNFFNELFELMNPNFRKNVLLIQESKCVQYEEFIFNNFCLLINNHLSVCIEKKNFI